MKSVSIRDAKNRLTEHAREVEEGETIIVTRSGRPVFDLVPHKRHGGLNRTAGKAYLLRLANARGTHSTRFQLAQGRPLTADC